MDASMLTAAVFITLCKPIIDLLQAIAALIAIYDALRKGLDWLGL